ncbi:acriflavin resistance protein [Longibacter salinarum]|uniref:Acriflavin resistance protein n=1 Tax=Longibacter salinarum TaxID=1850348 RepID=A0A2A8CU42_9BACT|nr:efflux RND transporter permease subunit [Longibacter salinarum]PEN10390.1 acriflavin resistance protein [Longibacter salinarum]
MSITDIAIKYRTSVVVLTLLLVFGGLYSYVSLPKEAQPSIEFPTIVVTTIYPGASPDDVESVVTQVVEQEISSINGIEELRSISTEGVSTIVIEFTPDVEVSEASQKVREKVDIAKADLPEDTEEPLINEIDTSEFPILSVNLAAEYSLARLKQVAEDVQDDIEGIPSVLEATLIGGLEREVQVDVDLRALQGYGLSFNDLINTIRAENANLPGGSIDVDRLNYLVRVDGQFDNPEREIADLVVRSDGNSSVHVRDVADVTFGFKDQETYARLKVLKEERDEGGLRQVNDLDADMLQVITLNVKKRSGDNILETSEEVKALLDDYAFPSGTQVTITGDQSENVRTLVKDLENNIISGLIFVVAVLLFFLGVRNATLVGIAIPLSMFVTFLVFQALGYTLNFIILFSLIIALGMLVDNAVVIVENIYRFKENGYSNFEAARLGTAEVGGAVVASTATTVAAFAPMLFWPGIIGEFMSYLPLTLIITLLSSLFVAIIINPVITGIFVRVEGEEPENKRTIPKTAKWVGAGAIVLLGLLLGLANWKTLVVILVGIPLLYFLHTRVFKPMGDRFVQTGLPRLIAMYRDFLKNMLARDYSVRYAMWRNVTALASFTLGLLMSIAGLALSGVGPQISGIPFGAAALVLLVPGGILLLIGIVGVILHAFEAVFLGGRTSVKAGLVFAVLMATILGLIYVSPRPLDAITMAEMMIAPILIVIVGSLGAILNADGPLIATDNRTKLLSGAIATLLLILGMYQLAPTGFEFFPTTDPNLIQVTLDAPLGTNVESSNRVAMEARQRVEDLLRTDEAARENVKNLNVNVGIGGDSQFGGGANRAERSRLTLNMVDYADRAESSASTLKRLRDELAGLPGVDIDFSQDENGPPTGPPVNIEISGPEFGTIKDISETIKQRLEKGVQMGKLDGLVDIRDDLNTGRPELAVEIDRERAAQFGLSTSAIGQTVRAAINGTEASQYRDGEDEYDITVRLREADRQSLESLKELTVRNTRGQEVPLVSVASFDEGTGFGSITRLDQSRVVTVQGDAAPGANANEVLGRVRTYLEDYRMNELPSGYSLKYTGENEDMNESFGFLTVALLIGVALISMVLIAQFNSVSAPFIIMVAVGLSLIGVLLGLILTRTPFGLMTFIGLISLAGIVVNNSIVLVDYVMQLRNQGLEKQHAIIEGGATRLRPVLLTALTTILGLIPLTFGINIDFVGLITDFAPNFQFGSENTQFWGPMGTAIISGLTFGTFLTLVIVPVMYSAFDSLGVHLALAFGGSPSGGAITTDAVAGTGELAMSGGNGVSSTQPTGDGSGFNPVKRDDSRHD